MTLLVEILSLVAQLILELIIHLLAFALRNSWFSLHAKGISRASYLVSTICGLHLASAIAVPILIEDPVFILSAAYSAPAIIASILVAIFTAFLPEVIKRTHATQSGANSSTGHGGEAGSYILSYFLGLTIVFGGISLWSAQHERQTLTDRLCSGFGDQITQEWKERGNSLLSLAEKLSQQNIRKKFPCPDSASPH